MLPRLLVAAAVFWLAYNAGTYALASRTILAITVWWAILVGLALGVLSARRISRPVAATGGLLLAFGVWTGLSVAWAIDRQNAFEELNRVALYLGVFLLVSLAPLANRLGTIADALGLGLAVVSLAALASRLFPEAFRDGPLPAPLELAPHRLTFPVGYWNGVATLVAFSVPLLLRSAVVAASPVARAAALGVVPGLAAALYLTASRGGIAAALLGLSIYVALAPRRAELLPALVVGALGAAAGAWIVVARPALSTGLYATSSAEPQARSAALLLLLACLAAGAAFIALSRVRLAIRGPRPAIAWLALGGATAAATVTVLTAGDLGARFRQFKEPPVAVTGHDPAFIGAHLFSGAGGGRWQFWGAAIDEFKSSPLIGRGAGSFEVWWADHAPYAYSVRDAHSLYLETFGELGLVGLVLLLAAVGVSLAVAAKGTLGAAPATRTAGAALTAVVVQFVFVAAIDWMWEVTAVAVVAFTALAASVAGTAQRSALELKAGRRPRALPIGLAVLAVIAIGAEVTLLLGGS